MSRANEIASRLAQGEDFATLANNYNELGSIQVNISRDDLPAAVEEIAFQMENDEVSGKITVDGGFYFIKCLNKYNQELTEANKANIVDKEKRKLLMMNTMDLFLPEFEYQRRTLGESGT